MDESEFEPIYFTQAGERRFSPYTLPLTLIERQAILRHLQSLKATFTCASCRAGVDRTGVDRCPRCKLLNRRSTRNGYSTPQTSLDASQT